MPAYGGKLPVSLIVSASKNRPTIARQQAKSKAERTEHQKLVLIEHMLRWHLRLRLLRLRRAAGAAAGATAAADAARILLRVNFGEWRLKMRA